MALMGILTKEEATAVRAAISSTNKSYGIIARELNVSDKTLRTMLGSNKTEPREVGIGLINNTKTMFPECFDKQDQAQTIDTEPKTSESIIKLLEDSSLKQTLHLISRYGDQTHR
jgi:hypothetical protein